MAAAAARPASGSNPAQCAGSSPAQGGPCMPGQPKGGYLQHIRRVRAVVVRVARFVGLLNRVEECFCSRSLDLPLRVLRGHPAAHACCLSRPDDDHMHASCYCLQGADAPPLRTSVLTHMGAGAVGITAIHRPSLPVRPSLSSVFQCSSKGLGGSCQTAPGSVRRTLCLKRFSFGS